MSVVFWISLAVLILAVYYSAVALSLITVSRSALQERLEGAPRENLGEWLFTHHRSARLVMSLVRMILRVSFVALVTIEMIGVGETVRLTYGNLALAMLLAVAFLWVFTTVLSSALARHASVGLIVSALPTMRIITVICSPLTGALAFIDEAIRRLSGANLREREEEAEAELLRSIEDTQREGALDEKAATLLENIVEFSSTDVGEVMTPRTDIDGIEITDDLAAIRAFIGKVGHSRIPVFEDDLDHIVGILYVKDLVPYLGEDVSDLQLRPILRQPIVVPETKPVRELLSDFQKSEVHMAMVIDEYGGTAGLVTIEDVLEEIVGEIHDEHEPEDETEPTLQKLG